MDTLEISKAVASARRLFTRPTNVNTSDGVEIILCKSMPRSGHHFLAVMLRRYFGADFHYCEFYKPENCCKAMPCRKPRPGNMKNRYFMQKSHDFRLRDRVLSQYKHIIQYRHPIPRSQSNFELAVRNGLRDDNEKSFRKFLKKDTRYFVRFYNKWMTRKPEQSCLLSYESLMERPGDSLIHAVEFITGAGVDNAKIDETITKVSKLNVQTREPFQPRSVKDHQYYDPDLLQKVEKKVFAACPGLDLPRYF